MNAENPSATRNIALILSSGTGARFRSETPKQLMKLAGKTVLEHTLDCFEQHPEIEEIIIITTTDQRPVVEELILRGSYRKTLRILIGGPTRQASTAVGAAAIDGDQHKVLVHDAVRPLLDQATIDRCLSALDEYDCVDTAIPSSDTIIRATGTEFIAEIPDRSMLRLGQTPQGFRSGLLRKAHDLAAAAKDLKVTDDCGLVLHFNLAHIKIVEGHTSNIKITHPSDIYLADRLFHLRTQSAVGMPDPLALSGKVLVVFGASRGIGHAICELASSYGATVVPVSRSQCGIDVCDPIAVRGVLDQTIARHGRIDMVANTAGLLRTGPLSGQDYSSIAEQIAVNVTGGIVIAKESFEILRHNGGSIALFTSSSYTRGRALSAIYSATKAAIVNLIQGLSQEYMSAGVRINAINPERTATPMRAENFGNEPMNQLLSAETVAAATLSTLLSRSSGEVVDVRR